MALGSGNNQGGGNNNRGLYEQTYYSRLRFKNENDKLQINFSYWKGTLKLSVTEIPKSYDGTGSAKVDELAFIHLSPTKARQMAKIVQRYIDNPEESAPRGVNTGASDTQGLLAIGRNNGVPYLVVAKIDANGKYLQNQIFNFNHDYNYDLEFSDMSKLVFSKQFDNNVELEMFHSILDEYSRSSSGAYAYSVWDIDRYEAAKQSNLIWKIAEKVGVERQGNRNGGGGSSSNSYFNNPKQNDGSGDGFNGMNKPSGYSTGSIEDLEGEFA